MQKYHWQHYQAYQRTNSLPVAWVDWLLDPGSFMQRLKAYAIREPTVHVLSQRYEWLSKDERESLHVPERQYGLVREVLIDSQEGQWMFARTVFPLATLTGKDRRLAYLKNRSLGSVLFNDPRVRRSEFEIARIMPDSVWHRKIKHVADISQERLWARRSLFFIQHKSLLLAEVFLPAIKTLQR